MMGIGGALVGESLAVGGAIAGIGIMAEGTKLIANEINHIAPNAEKKLREKG